MGNGFYEVKELFPEIKVFIKRDKSREFRKNIP